MPGFFASADPLRSLHASGLIYTIYGGSRLVVVRRLFVTPVVGTADQHISFILGVYSTLYSGGTQVALPGVPTGHTAAVAVHTVAPTAGTLVGNIRAIRSFVSQPGLGASDPVDFDLRDSPQLLKSSTDGLGIVVAAANSISSAFHVLWDEQ